MNQKSDSVPDTSPHSPQEGYARKLYQALDRLATVENMANAEVRVYRGAFTELFGSTGIPWGQYKPVKDLLEYNRCIEQVEKGARNRPTVVVLHGLPDGPLVKPEKKVLQEGLTLEDRVAKLEAQCQTLENLVGGTHLPSVLEELAQRLDGKDGSNG